MEKEFNEQESITVIQKMIEKVKVEFNDDSFYYLLWGWLVFGASISNFILLKINYEYASIPWALMPLGVIITAVYAFRHERNKRVRTYMDDFFKYVLIAFGVSLAIVLFLQSKLLLNTYPMALMVYGSFLFIAGGAINFRPLIIGGIVNWICGITAFFVSFDIQLLILAAGVILGYVIPGYRLKAHYKKNVQGA